MTQTKKLQLAGGTVLTLNLEPHGIHELQVENENLHVALVITGDDLRRLCSLPGVESCGNCKFGRVDANGVTRCHLKPPKKRGDEIYFPRMNAADFCGKYRPHPPIPAPRSEPRAVAADLA